MAREETVLLEEGRKELVRVTAQREDCGTARAGLLNEAEELAVRMEAAARAAKQAELANQKSTAVALPAPAAPPTGSASPTRPLARRRSL